MDAEKVIDKLNEIASLAVQHYLEIATRRMLIVGWVEVVIAVLIIVATVPVVWFSVRHHSKAGWERLSSVGVAMILLMTMCAIVVPVLLTSGLPMVIAPEYEAIQSLLELVK